MTLHPEWLDWPETQGLIAAFDGGTLRFVGGAVRDALLGRVVTDVDAATMLLPEAVMQALAAKRIRAIPTGIDHGTVTAVIGQRHFEITTLRRDVATDGRHARVAYTDDWKEDASRRDFTMNALYLSPEGELFDYFGGEMDARAGHVRFIGDPAARIAEDYLRILRFFRFHAHYGKGEPDADALDACAQAASHIASLSGERIQQEMFKLLSASQSYLVIKLMLKNGILEHALGVHVDNVTTLERLENTFPDSNPITKLTALLGPLDDSTEARKKLAERLRLSNALAGPLQKARYIPPNVTPAEQYQSYIQTSHPIFSTSVMVSSTTNVSINPYKHMIEFSPPPFPVTGEDLIALGYQPGKEIGVQLRRLQDEWANSNYQLTRKQLLARVPPR